MKYTAKQSHQAPNAAARELAARMIREGRAFGHRSFFRYAWEMIRHARFYAMASELFTYLRRLRLLTVALRFISLLFTLLQTGTLVLLSTLLFVILLPLLLLATIATLLTAAIKSRQSNRKMRRYLYQKHLYVLFLPKEPGDFFAHHVQSLAARERSAVILISPFWFLGRGLLGKHVYCTVCRERENVFLVRQYYFFTLRRHVPEFADAAYIH